MENNAIQKKLDLQKLLAPAALVILYVAFSIIAKDAFFSLTMVQIFWSPATISALWPSA